MRCAATSARSRYATKTGPSSRKLSMTQPRGFSWIKKRLLAAMAFPESKEDLEWLRQHWIEVLISLTEEPVRRDWVNEAGILVVHEPIVDMEAPTQDQLSHCLSAIARAHKQK